MENPFPGMNPYLEAYWRDVHTSLMVYIRDHLQDQLPGDLIARVEESVSIDADEESRQVSPDVRVVEEPGGWTARGGAVATATVNVAEPLLIPIEEPPPRHVEIIDPKSGNRVVTAIEVLSPTNKLDTDGLKAYRCKQREYVSGGVNLVEIDLLRRGGFIVAAPHELIEPSRRAPYYVCVRRVTKPGWAAVVPLPLRQRLTAISVPLRPTDSDVQLDLQELINQCYRRGRYSSIDYRYDPNPPLTGDDAAWADTLLRSTGLR